MSNIFKVNNKDASTTSSASQGLTVRTKLLYVITHVCQNFGIHDIHGQILKIIYHESYLFYLVIFITIFPKLIFNPKNIFQKMYCLKRE